MEEVHAFPQAATFLPKGMTLRDYFTGQAIAGLCANPAVDLYGNKETAEWVVYTARVIADAQIDGLKG